VNGWHRTVASWLLFQAGRLAGTVANVLDRVLECPAATYQRLMACSVELDREGRVWKYVPEERREDV